MGCDIHQYNLIYDTGLYFRTGAVTDQESYSEDDECYYSCSKIPELVPYRNYFIFGVLAGVRSADFEITKDRHDCYPSALSKQDLALISDDRHSPVWYYCPKLLAQLQETEKKMKRRMAALRRTEPYFNGSADEEEFEYEIDAVKELITKLKESRKKFTSMESWEKSIILFNFDS